MIKNTKLLSSKKFRLIFSIGFLSALFLILLAFFISILFSKANAQIPSLTEYTVNFLNYDESVLETKTYTLNEIPSYTGETPTRVEKGYNYTFTSWDKEIEPVTCDINYIAQYSKETKKFKVTWKSSLYQVLNVEEYEYNEMPEYKGEVPTKTSDGEEVKYEFVGWSSKLKPVTFDTTYIAFFDTYYLVKFVDEDKILQEGYVKKGDFPKFNGETPTRENNYDLLKSYSFDKWEPAFTKVTSSRTYYAKFFTEKITYQYEILYTPYVGYPLSKVSFNDFDEISTFSSDCLYIDKNTNITYSVDELKTLPYGKYEFDEIKKMDITIEFAVANKEKYNALKYDHIISEYMDTNLPSEFYANKIYTFDYSLNEEYKDAIVTSQITSPHRSTIDIENGGTFKFNELSATIKIRVELPENDVVNLSVHNYASIYADFYGEGQWIKASEQYFQKLSIPKGSEVILNTKLKNESDNYEFLGWSDYQLNILGTTPTFTYYVKKDTHLFINYNIGGKIDFNALIHEFQFTDDIVCQVYKYDENGDKHLMEFTDGYKFEFNEKLEFIGFRSKTNSYFYEGSGMYFYDDDHRITGGDARTLESGLMLNTTRMRDLSLTIVPNNYQVGITYNSNECEAKVICEGQVPVLLPHHRYTFSVDYNKEFKIDVKVKEGYRFVGFFNYSTDELISSNIDEVFTGELDGNIDIKVVCEPIN